MAARDKLADALLERQEALAVQRNPLEGLWNQLARFVLPTKMTYPEALPGGGTRDRAITDSTAPNALELFASSLVALLADPSKKWFDVGWSGKNAYGATGDASMPPALAKWGEELVETILYLMVSSRRNFYSVLHQLLIDLGLIGTACCYVEPDPRSLSSFRFWHIPMQSIAIDEGEDGIVDTVVRDAPISPRKAAQRWPNRRLGKSIEAALEAAFRSDKSASHHITRPARFIHACFPATDGDLVRLFNDASVKPAIEWPYYSVWVNAQDRVVVDASGYEQFPYMVPRWLRDGAQCGVYGRSPAMTAAGNILMVNYLRECQIRGTQKLVDPPLVIPFGALLSPVRMWPGGTTFTDGEVDIKPLIPPGASRIEVGEAMIEKSQRDIREAFFAPLFLSPDSPVKTATEVLNQVDERNRALSPMAFRLQDELFTPLILRMVTACIRNKIIDPPPMDVSRMQIRYLSPITASARQLDALNVARLFQYMQPWAAVDPGVFDNYDLDAIAQLSHSASGAPAPVLRPKAKVTEIRKQRQEQIAQQQMMEALPQAASAAANLISAGARKTSADKK